MADYGLQNQKAALYRGIKVVPLEIGLRSENFGQVIFASLVICGVGTHFKRTVWLRCWGLLGHSYFVLYVSLYCTFGAVSPATQMFLLQRAQAPALEQAFSLRLHKDEGRSLMLNPETRNNLYTIM